MRTSTKSHTLSIPISYLEVPRTFISKERHPSAFEPLKDSIDKRTTIDTFSTAEPRIQNCSIDEFSTTSDELTTSLESFSCLHSSNFEQGPGRLKNKSENLTGLVQSTKELLLMYGISLSIDLPGKYYKKISDILKGLSSEIAYFPYGFFMKINLRQFVISCETVPNGLSNNFSVQDDVLITKNNGIERLYAIIFDHIFVKKPTIERDWKSRLITMNSSGDDIMERCSLKEIFIALMKNRNDPLLKQEMNILRDILTEHFPIELNKSWFETRRLIKKKVFRVSFST